MRCSIFILLLLSFILCKAEPAVTQSQIDEAVKAYNDSDYIRSVALLQDIVKQEGGNTQIYCDLGNAYVRLENYGSAVLNYKKALKLNPSNRLASGNLAYVEQIVSLENEGMVVDRNLDPSPAGKSFFKGMRETVEFPGSNCWAWLAGSFFIIFCSALGIYLFVSNPKWKKISFFTAAPSLVVSGICLALAFSSKASVEKVDECVLMVPKASLKESPSSDAKDVAVPLCGGTVFRVMEKKKDNDKAEWINVWLNDDFSGWIPADDVELVEV